jgi:hypothetical protein
MCLNSRRRPGRACGSSTAARRRHRRTELHLKCSARSAQPIRHRRTAPQAPRNRIRANADNRKASGPSLFERLWQPSLVTIYRKPVSGVFRHNAFWFRGLWRKPGQHFAVRGSNPAGQFLQEEYDEVQRTCARTRRNFWRCTSGELLSRPRYRGRIRAVHHGDQVRHRGDRPDQANRDHDGDYPCEHLHPLYVALSLPIEGFVAAPM